MKRRWGQALWWRRILVVLNVLVVLLILASFLFALPVLWWALPMIVVEGGTFALLALDKRRKQRDGSYWGPRL
jgi:hypothetical protein